MGGLWIDSSIFVSKKVSEDFFKQREWWSINLHNKDEKIINLGQKITERRWSGFIQMGTKANDINSFLCDAYELYYEKHDCLIDYFMQNLLIKIAYNNISYIKNIIDSIPFNNCNVYSLYDNIDNEFNEDLYAKWNKNTTFYKLTQKRSYNISDSKNKISFYGAVKKYCEDTEENNYEKD